MLTNYHVRQIKYFSTIFLIFIFSIFLIGNIIGIFVRTPVKSNENDYTLKHGFPLFHNAGAYLKILKSYPYNPGTKLSFYRLSKGESFWDVAKNNNISIDTLIAANPFLDSLVASKDIEVVIPAEDGSLVAFESYFDIADLNKIFNSKARGDYTPSVFGLFSPDDIKFVFFKSRKPIIVNNKIEGLYNIRRNYQMPVENGHFTSLYGARVDPFIHMTKIHEGIDIAQRTGTPISPVREGIVNFTGWKNGYGKCIQILHKDGYVSIYAHCSEILTEQGKFVSKETIIGKVGSTGRSTGPHLHLEIKRHGKNIDPLYFIW